MGTGTSIDAHISAALAAASGPLNARQISAHLAARGIDVPRRSINARLYRGSVAEQTDGGPPPRWRLRGGQPEATKRPRPAVRAPSQETPRRVGLTRDLRTWQSEAIAAWRQRQRHGIVEAVTGSGKTMVGLAAITEAVTAGERVVVLVPTVPLVDQWIDDIRRFTFGVRAGAVSSGRCASFATVDVVVTTVHSACSNPPLADGRGPAFVVADECHRYGSSAFAESLLPGYGARLGLTATLERNDDGVETFLNPFFGDIVYSLSYERALRDNVIAPFRVALVAVDFTPAEARTYELADERARSCRSFLTNAAGVPAEPFGEFMKQVQRLSGAESLVPGGPPPSKRVVRSARGYLKAFADRRQLMAETTVKTAALEGLVEAVREASGTLVFSESIVSAELARTRLGAHGLRTAAVHSQTSQPERKAVLKLFEARNLDVLAAPRVLDEGIDVPEADLAIILAGSRTRRQMIQRMGRVLRPKQDDRVARFVIMYVRGTGEDPALQGDLGFLGVVTDAAEEIGSFSADEGLGDVVAFLSSDRKTPWSECVSTPIPATPASPWLPGERRPSPTAVTPAPIPTPRPAPPERPVIELLLGRSVPVPLAVLQREYERRWGWLTATELAAFPDYARRFDGRANVAVRALWRAPPLLAVSPLWPRGPAAQVLSQYVGSRGTSACASFLSRSGLLGALAAWFDPETEGRTLVNDSITEQLDDLTRLLARSDRASDVPGAPGWLQRASSWEVMLLADIDTEGMDPRATVRLAVEDVPSLVLEHGRAPHGARLPVRQLVEIVRAARRVAERQDRIDELGDRARALAKSLESLLRSHVPDTCWFLPPPPPAPPSTHVAAQPADRAKPQAVVRPASSGPARRARGRTNSMDNAKRFCPACGFIAAMTCRCS